MEEETYEEHYEREDLYSRLRTILYYFKLRGRVDQIDLTMQRVMAEVDKYKEDKDALPS